MTLTQLATDDFTKLLFEYAEKMIKNSKMNEDTEITPNNIYQPAHMANRDLLLEIIKKSHLPGSTILGVENLLKLYELAQQGKSCIILSEHVSNLDVPSMFTRFYDHPNNKLKEVFEKIIFIAGVKLNENSVVKMFTEMFSRIVIFPIRSLDKMKGKSEFEEQIRIARKINIKSTRKVRELRTQGNIFVMYPAGTRYRPWNPATKKAIKETTSYLNSFDYFCFSSINGNNMVPEEHENMTGETFKKDVLVFSFGEVRKAKDFINGIKEKHQLTSLDDTEKVKQIVADNIMDQIDILHQKGDEYIKNLKNN